MEQADDQAREIAELRDRLSRLSQASLRINESIDFDTVLQGVLDSACSLTGARYGVITLLDEPGRIQDFVTSGLTQEEHRRFTDLPEGMMFFQYLSNIQGAFDVLAGGAGSLGDGLEGLPEGGLVEGVGIGGLGHEGYHFLPAGAVGLLAILVVAAAQHSSLLATVSAGAGQRVDDFSQGHVSPELYLGIPISGQAI